MTNTTTKEDYLEFIREQEKDQPDQIFSTQVPTENPIYLQNGVFNTRIGSEIANLGTEMQGVILQVRRKLIAFTPYQNGRPGYLKLSTSSVKSNTDMVSDRISKEIGIFHEMEKKHKAKVQFMLFIFDNEEMKLLQVDDDSHLLMHYQLMTEKYGHISGGFTKFEVVNGKKPAIGMTDMGEIDDETAGKLKQEFQEIEEKYASEQKSMRETVKTNHSLV